jgi:hypothetical protein
VRYACIRMAGVVRLMSAEKVFNTWRGQGADALTA